MTIRLSARDMWLLLWLSQMGGAPMDIVASLLAIWPLRKRADDTGTTPVSEVNAYRVVARLKKAGKLIDETLRPVPGPGWAVPTASTASLLLDMSVKPWIPSPMMAAHLSTTARVRLALAAGMVEDTWISERILRHRNGFQTVAGESMPHVHDGHWTDEYGRLHAIEVELTRKGSADARATMQASYDAAKDAGAHRLVYYCESPEVRARVRAAAADLNLTEGGPEITAPLLSKLLHPSPAAVHGLSLFAAGGAAS
ncbi:hypothetical protein IU501_07220 [Nocardia otitidiscaviarum]|uniref:hypothetical protein n=1 Tax=Nocardia otitidiscaviarum TaxID=1823 RepID=UPI0018943ABD|nr:hypothetical protein [Nocardia otitidiscaviarum]MBF6132792.1 hypothetical protein [Nocardia otitidiscaviarum]